MTRLIAYSAAFSFCLFPWLFPVHAANACAAAQDGQPCRAVARQDQRAEALGAPDREADGSDEGASDNASEGVDDPRVDDPAQDGSDAPATETLTLTSTPVGATVTINHSEVGKTPVIIDRATYDDEANLDIEWSLDGYDAQRRVIRLDPYDDAMEMHVILPASTTDAVAAVFSVLFNTHRTYVAGARYQHMFAGRWFLHGSLGATFNGGFWINAGVGMDKSLFEPRASPLFGLESYDFALTPSIDVDFVLVPRLAPGAAIYVNMVGLRAYWLFANLGVGYVIDDGYNNIGLGVRASAGVQLFL